MKRKVERVYRDRFLTEEEAAHYDEIRRKVMEEFPPRYPLPTAKTVPAWQDLLRAVQDSGRPLEEIAKDAHISLRLLKQFLDGRLDIPLGIADRLAASLGLHLTVGS